MTNQFHRLDADAPLAISRSTFRRIERIDEYPDDSWLDNDAGRERLHAFRDGTWHLISIQASATLRIPHGRRVVSKTITSPGLWGIESDAGDDYRDRIFADQCVKLAALCEALGFAVTG